MRNLVLPLVFGCAPDPVGGKPLSEIPAASCGDAGPDAVPALGTPPATVLVVVMDTTRRDALSWNRPDRDTTPSLDLLRAGGVLYDRVQVVRGLTSVSLSSVITGAYPRTHGVRNNDADPIEADVATLAERFGEVGYRTVGVSANMCQLMDRGFDERYCTSSQEEPGLDQAVADTRLVDELLARVDVLDADTPVFAWAHFVDPHDPFTAREPWFSTWHPEPYDGPLDPPTTETLAEISAAGVPLTEADRAYLDAVYQSQVASTDAQIGRLIEGLRARGRLDDAAILFVMDHGEELAERSSYFYHGCSPYQRVMEVSAVLWAPGRLPAGTELAGRVSAVDLAPTLLEVAGLPADGPAEGTSRLDEVLRCVEPRDAVFFERGPETAGVVVDEKVLILDPREGYASCKEYGREHPYPGEPLALYDLESDPLQLENLASDDPVGAMALAALVCGWVTDGPWTDGRNALTLACAGE